MKRILTLLVLTVLLGGVSGCRFMDCVWRGGPARQTTATVTCPTVCPPVCPPVNPCDPCAGAPAIVTPGPETYAPAR